MKPKKTVFERNPRKTLFIVYLILFSVSMIGFEIIAKTILALKNQNTFPLFSYIKIDKKKCDQAFLDPIFGYAHSKCDRFNIEQSPSFAIYRSIYPEKQKHKIVTLGGSTTDPIIMGKRKGIGPDNWPKLLNDLCSEKKLNCEIFNGGQGGFTSSQELFKLIRDVVPLQPDVVISLNGINEIYFWRSSLDNRYPYLSDYQRYLFRAIAEGKKYRRFREKPSRQILMPNLTKLLKLFWKRQDRMNSLSNRKLNLVPLDKEQLDKLDELNKLGLNYGTRYYLQPWTIWKRNVEMMKVICDHFGINYYVFLQPTLGVGKYNYSKTDLVIKQQGTDDYYKNINKVYLELRNICSSLDYCFDMVDLFEGKSDLYDDPRHPNAKGNSLQARFIFAEIARKWKDNYENKKQ